MERDWLLTIFVSAGQSRKLGQRSEAIEAVSEGVLSPDTRVMVRLGSGERVQRRAIECEHLVDLFPAAVAEPIAPEPISVAEGNSDPEPEAAIEIAPVPLPVSDPEPEMEAEAPPTREAASIPESTTGSETETAQAEAVGTGSPPITASSSESVPEAEPESEADDEALHEAEPGLEQAAQPDVEPEREMLDPTPEPEPTDEITHQPQPEPESAPASASEPASPAVPKPDSAPDVEAVQAEPVADDWEYDPPPATKSLGNVVKVGIIGLILALLVAGAYVWFGGEEPGGTRYLLSDVSGFEAPKPSAKSGDRLSYGQAVLVEPSETDGWLRVVDGPFKGLYLPGTLLSREAPPQIDKSGAGMIAAGDGMQLHIAPDETSEVVGSIPAGNNRFAQGIVQGRDGNSWFVFLIDEDSLPRSAFGLRGSTPPVEQAAATPTPTVESDTPVPVEADNPAAASASNMDSCAGIRRKLARFVCQDPGLRDNESEFSAAYARAAARFGQAGQTLQPMARFAARVAAQS